MVHPNSRRISRVPRYLGYTFRGLTPVAYQTITVYGLPFQDNSAKRRLCNSVATPYRRTMHPITPNVQRTRAITYIRFGLFPVRSPLLRESPIGFFSSRYLDVSVPWVSLLKSYRFKLGCRGIYPRPVSRFGNPGIKSRSRLPQAYRSLPRPSSPVRAKASTICP